MADEPKEPFRVLDHEDFRKLSIDDKVAYLQRAMNAQKLIHAQLQEGLSKLIKPRG